jgi:hypothetical protein
MGPLGLAILILLFVGFGPLSGKNPGENASGTSVVSYYNTHQGQGWAQLYVIALGLALLVLFVSQLRRVLRGAEDKGGPLPSVVYAAGILFAGGLIASGGVDHMALLLAAHNHQAAIAQNLNFVSANNELPLIFGMALLTLATGVAILTRSALPKWLGWVSIVIGVVCVAGPIGFFGVLAGGVWLPVLGFVIGARAKSAPQGSINEISEVVVVIDEVIT